MQFKGIWVLDPITDKPSVSLTNLVVSILALVIAIGLHIAGKSETTSVALEYFLGSASLYFGRRFTSSKGDVAEKISEEVK